VGHRKFVLFGLGAVIVLVIAITATSLGDNLTYYLYPSEAVARRAEFPDGERFRLAGEVVPGSLVEKSDALSFQVTDGAATIQVVLVGPPPSLFTDKVPVLLEGSWSGEGFVADAALIRHDENYVVPEEGGAYPEG
jgi:cytochrome c-type biogenesis protein CcmE